MHQWLCDLLSLSRGWWKLFVGYGLLKRPLTGQINSTALSCSKRPTKHAQSQICHTQSIVSWLFPAGTSWCMWWGHIWVLVMRATVVSSRKRILRGGLESSSLRSSWALLVMLWKPTSLHWGLSFCLCLSRFCSSWTSLLGRWFPFLAAQEPPLAFQDKHIPPTSHTGPQERIHSSITNCTVSQKPALAQRKNHVDILASYIQMQTHVENCCDSLNAALNWCSALLQPFLLFNSSRCSGARKFSTTKQT